mgnify:CR=1 FL=1
MATTGVNRDMAFLGGLLPRVDSPVNIHMGMPALRARALCTPYALQRAASSQPGEIILHPSFYEPGTAAGISLLGHEMWHQWQFQQTPDLLDHYAKEESQVKAQGLPPYANKYEGDAYQFEAEVYRAAIAAGYPPGNHVPLLIDVGLASERPGAAILASPFVLAFATGMGIAAGRIILGGLFRK